MTRIIGDCRDHIYPLDNDSLYIVDPPWDEPELFNVAAGADNRIVFADAQRSFDAISCNGAPSWVLSWDCVSSWYVPNRPIKRMKLCYVYGDVSRFRIREIRNRTTNRDVKKISTRNTRGKYESIQNVHPLMSDVFTMMLSTMKKTHKHEKPSMWLEMIIGNLFPHITNVIDCFAGSFVAESICSKLGKKYTGIDLMQPPANVNDVELEQLALL